MIVADKVAEWMEERDIRHAFGIIGAGNVALFDAIARRGFTEIVCCHHEQACVMAATYYYRTSGRISVALVTTGAGSSNAITGVMAAFMDSIPVLVISGNEPTKYFDMPHPRVVGVQGFDSKNVALSFTKDAYRFSEHRSSYGEELALDFSLRLALEPRQGPVWIDICRDIQVAHV